MRLNKRHPLALSLAMALASFQAYGQQPASPIGQQPAPAIGEQPAPPGAQPPAPTVSQQPPPPGVQQPGPSTSQQPTPAAAQQPGPAVLTCIIARNWSLQSDGDLKSVGGNAAGQGAGPEPMRNIFTVSRNTGRMIGRAVDNSRSDYWDAWVLDRGSDQQSFKVLSKNKAGYIHTYYLAVLMYEQGPSKPFLLIDNGDILTGTCE